MRKTVFIVTEQRTFASEREAREVLQQRVTLWLKGALAGGDGPPRRPQTSA